MPITDRDIAALCLGIYPGNPPVVWDHFDDGSGPDGVCWGVKHVDDVSIVVLRGTVTLGDWLRNFQAWVEPIHHDDLGPVHAGFYSGMRTVQRELTKEIVPSGPLIICGHSLGAARAVILSALLTRGGRAPIARICFGEPRAGFAPLGEILAPIGQQRSYRNRNATDHDEITDLPFSLPPLFAYQHPTELIDLTVSPMPHTPWIFRFHVPELYAGATPATPIILKEGGLDLAP
jgi:hypothetical protein